MRHLIEWDTLEVRVNGEKVSEIARQLIGLPPPLERIGFRFENGRILVEGSIRKLFNIPFTVEIARLDVAGQKIEIPVTKISAAGLPVPTLLLDLLKSRIPRDVVDYREPATFVLSLDRFLPSFVSVEVQKIWLIDGGLAVTLGRGGANMPTGALDGKQRDEDAVQRDGQ